MLINFKPKLIQVPQIISYVCFDNVNLNFATKIVFLKRSFLTSFHLFRIKYFEKKHLIGWNINL